MLSLTASKSNRGTNGIGVSEKGFDWFFRSKEYNTYIFPFFRIKYIFESTVLQGILDKKNSLKRLGGLSYRRGFLELTRK